MEFAGECRVDDMRMDRPLQRATRLAQLVERKTLNLVVVGSIPTGGVFWLGSIPLCSSKVCGPTVVIQEKPL